jgi:uncharacterized protein DUF955
MTSFSAPPRHPLNQWLPEVDELVRDLRGLRSVRFQLEKVATRAGVLVEWLPLRQRLRGLTLDGERIILDDQLRGAQANFTFAHELAHVFQRRNHFAGLRRSEEEWFADWFAREMLLPRAWLRRDWRGPDLAALHVDRMTAALQLSVVGRAPQIMRFGDRVLCGVCGAHHHRWGCECTALRRSPANERQRLPEAPNFFGRRPGRADSIQLSMLDRNRCPQAIAQRAW